MGGFAWVTLATNDSYSLGALVLAHSLKAVGTAQQLAVLVTPGVTSAMRDKLASVFDLVQEVNVLDSRDETNLRLLKRPELGITFTKLHCWRLTQYEKCVFLDADTLVLQNSDELFEREEFSAAPDVGWPDCFNSGVFVYRPSLDTYEKLIQFALEKGSFDGGDQGLLNLYFSDWAHKDISRHLPFIYNMCSTACYSYLPAFKQFGANAKIIHFIGAQKPWLQYFNTETRKVQPSGDSSHLQDVLQRWWDIFCSLIHPHLSPAMAGLAGAFAQLTLGVPRTAEQDALENVLRKQAWEVGNIDYLGRDSFDNIWSKIAETLSTAPLETLAETKASAPEPEPSAPAQSQSQTAPPQEEAKPVQPPVTPIAPTDTVTDKPKLDSIVSIPPVDEPKVEQQVSTDISSTPTSKDEVEPVKPEFEVIEKHVETPVVVSGSEADVSPKEPVKDKEVDSSLPQVQPEPAKPSGESEVAEKQVETPAVLSGTETKEVDTTQPQSQPEVPLTPKEKESVAEPVVCPIPEKKGATELETKVPEPQAPKEKETAVEVPKPQLPKETETVVEPACSLPQKKEEAPKATEAQVISAQQETPKVTPQVEETPKVPPQAEETPKVTPQAEETPKVTPQAEETPKVSPLVEETTVKPTAATPKEPVTSSQPPPEVPQQPEASPKKSKASTTPTDSSTPAASQPSAAAPSPKAAKKPSLKEVPKAPETSTAAAPSSPTPKDPSKAVASKDSPKTKVTEATPPATPGSPLVEKTKQSLVAEASVPDTPPPSEGAAATPTPPPRKTDKPKKVAAKPKK